MIFRKVFYSVIISVFISGLINSARASDPCDRKCLEGYIDKVLVAMIAHNPGQLMLAKNVRYTENGVELIPGDGMWGTLGARGKYNLYVCDMKAGQAGFYGTVSENDKINYIALRVKVDDALISEIELIVARPESTASPSTLSAGQRMEQIKSYRNNENQVINLQFFTLNRSIYVMLKHKETRQEWSCFPDGTIS
jgi:hypothetical protein